MKQIVLIILFSVLNMALCLGQNENASGKKKSKIGSFLKNTVEATTNLNVSNETFIVNPIPGFTFQYVSCTGNSSTQKVSFVFVLKHSIENQKVELGGGTCTDGQGKTYRVYSSVEFSSSSRQDVRTGIPLRVTYEFEGVLPSVKQMEIFTFKVQTMGANTANKGYDVEFRNVPINWDPKEEDTPATDAQ